jgi:hypothetical protein
MKYETLLNSFGSIKTFNSYWKLGISPTNVDSSKYNEWVFSPRNMNLSSKDIIDKLTYTQDCIYIYKKDLTIFLCDFKGYSVVVVDSKKKITRYNFPNISRTEQFLNLILIN